jgi:uncharacterized membrane protein
MVSLAALVLTITMVVVQLAMGQFSPRIVQRILEDKPSQLAVGIFVGTFAHFERPTICIPRSGVITRIDDEALVRIAAAGDTVLTLLPALGEFVPAGAALFESTEDASRIDADAAVRAIEVSLERTLDQDVAYGLRMLVDIAERSVSESPFLDPTTAVQAIDRLYDCLRQLAPRPFPDGQYRDETGKVRLVTRTMAWDDYVHLAFDEIRMAGAQSPQVVRRLRAALEDLGDRSGIG